jgi:hypothetical protein
VGEKEENPTHKNMLGPGIGESEYDGLIEKVGIVKAAVNLSNDLSPTRNIWDCLLTSDYVFNYFAFNHDVPCLV